MPAKTWRRRSMVKSKSSRGKDPNSATKLGLASAKARALDLGTAELAVIWERAT
jgi:hypothetical protein